MAHRLLPLPARRSVRASLTTSSVRRSPFSPSLSPNAALEASFRDTAIRLYHLVHQRPSLAAPIVDELGKLLRYAEAVAVPAPDHWPHAKRKKKTA